MDIGSIELFATALFTITNPIGSTAIFASMTGDLSHSEQSNIAMQSALAITIVLLVVLWVGQYILRFFGIDIAALETAGGIIVLSLGLSMLHNEPSKQSHTDVESSAAQEKSSIAVVPIAIPIVAGPGAITTVLLSASNQGGNIVSLVEMSTVCGLFGLLFWICFRFASRLSSLAGVHGIAIVTRVMGMILAAIACGMIASGLQKLLPGLA